MPFLTSMEPAHGPHDCKWPRQPLLLNIPFLLSKAGTSHLPFSPNFPGILSRLGCSCPELPPSSCKVTLTNIDSLWLLFLWGLGHGVTEFPSLTCRILSDIISITRGRRVQS